MSNLCRIPSVRAVALLGLALLLVLPVRVLAGTAALLRDIAIDPQATADSEVRQLTPFKDQVAFVAASSLWVSDGTGPGTRVVLQGNPEILGVINGFLLLTAGDSEGNGPRRLWRSDGTRAGTVPLTPADLPVPTRLENGALVVTDRVVYFLDCEDSQCDIWRSNGTPAGTALWKRQAGPGRLYSLTLAGDRLFAAAVENGGEGHLWTADTRTGAEATLTSWGYPETLGFPDLLTAAGGKLFFIAPAPGGGGGIELWASDGTTRGTRALTQFEAIHPFGETQWMKEIGGRVYFVANDVVHGHELWRSDGTPKGTVRISDFGYFEALRGLASTDLAQARGKILFNAEDGLTPTRLWMTDGRPESTAPFRDLCQGGTCELPQRGAPLVQIGSKVFFPGENGLWSTDGTLAGTHRFSGPLCDYACGYHTVFQALQGKIVFLARDDAHGIELWTSDGTAAGTRRLTDVPGGTSSETSFYGPVAGTVATVGSRTFFMARDRHGIELWVASGRETRLLVDLGLAVPGSDVLELTPVGDRLFFTACDRGNRAVWVSGGTPETTAQVPGTAGGCSTNYYTPTDLTAASGRLFFLQRDADRIPQLWSTDGGTPVQVTHMALTEGYIYASFAIEFQGRLLVPIRTGVELALWQSNAAGNGLVKLVDLPGISSAEGLRAAAGGDSEVYFRGFGTEDGLWRTDGTQAGTRLLAPEVYTDSDFVRVGSSVLFIADSRDANGAFEPGLWKTDGTPAGTAPVRMPLGSFYQPPQELAAFQGKAYFFAQDETWALWRSDGTEAGTVRVRQLADTTSPTGQTRFGLTVSAGKLYFTADDGVHGRELWTSDGTTEGTRMVVDVNPGKAAGAPGSSTLTAAGNRLYFAGNDGIHGTELWESDGTAAGTRLVQDIAPEAASSLPGQLTPAGGHLFFVADDLLSGREPWALPLAGPSGCQPSSTRLCLNGGRYQVEASWLTPQGQSGSGRPVALSADTGYFWFFEPDNVELVVKVLDGQGVNGHVWVFYGALSDVEYTITVTDTQTGLARRYFNPQGTLASVGDTRGFGPLGAHGANPTPPVSRAAASPLPLISEIPGKAATAPCEASARRLCLNDNRFAVEVSWKDFQNHTGQGTAVPLTGDTGMFWFFDAANIELVVKVLDGRPVNGKHWVFYGALSNVEYTLTVTDTQTGTVRTYKNPSGRFASAADTGAF